MIGEINGVIEGTKFASRQELHNANVHRGLMRGIAPQGYSIVLSGGYIDDVDDGDVIIYTGEGGRDQKTKRQVAEEPDPLIIKPWPPDFMRWIITIKKVIFNGMIKYLADDSQGILNGTGCSTSIFHILFDALQMERSDIFEGHFPNYRLAP